MKSLFEKEAVQALLPQKSPFVMVDSLFSYTENQIVSGFTATADNLFADGGYFSEAGLVEHMAQSVALHTGYAFFLRKENAPEGYIGSIKEVIINALPKIGQQVITTVTILQEFMGITLVSISTKVDDIEIASGQMKTVLAK